MAQLGWPSDGEPVAMLMTSHGEIERELADLREQIAILRSDEKRLMQFAKTYRLRADEAEAKLAAERALSNEMAAQLEHASFAYDPGGCQKMFEAWKDAREP
jgi:hypothetical protein